MKTPIARIHWVQICTYPTNDMIPPHKHDFFHYLYVIRGSGQLELEGNVYAMTPKRLLLVAPGKLHTFRNTGALPLVTCELKFAYGDTAMAAQMAAFPEAVDVRDTPVLGILQNIRREFGAKRPGSGEIIAMNMQEICIHIRRAVQTGEIARRDAGEDMSAVLRYIESNLDCNINLQDLANIVCLEKTYFLKKFKQVTGQTPMVYTREARINKAKELLKYSDMSITQIARAVGFQTLHHFSRQFSGATGVSPSAYKAAYRMENRSP